jgi:hypothetical protein
MTTMPRRHPSLNPFIAGGHSSEPNQGEGPPAVVHRGQKSVHLLRAENLVQIITGAGGRI